MIRFATLRRSVHASPKRREAGFLGAAPMRVLVIEDEPPLLDAVAQALREGGYAVDESADGEDGLYKATAWEYDAVVLDLMLPKVDGWTLLAALRRTRATPVLV